MSFTGGSDWSGFMSRSPLPIDQTLLLLWLCPLYTTEECLSATYERNMGQTYMFSLLGLRLETSPRKRPYLTLATWIKNHVDENIASTGLLELSPRETSHVHRRSFNQEDALRSQVNIKFMQEEIRGAVREVFSSKGLAPISSEALTAFHEKYPPGPGRFQLSSSCRWKYTSA